MAVEEEYHKRGTRGGAANKKRVWWELQEDVIDKVQQRFGFTPPKLQWEQGSEVQLAALRAWKPGRHRAALGGASQVASAYGPSHPGNP